MSTENIGESQRDVVALLTFRDERMKADITV